MNFQVPWYDSAFQPSSATHVKKNAEHLPALSSARKPGKGHRHFSCTRHIQ